MRSHPCLTLVNGAGLAMSTCDTIDLLHGKCSNFLDAGGKATPETIKEAFRIVLKDTKVHSAIHF
jgi:succinyl-CoA synthetase beta subunit